MALTLYGNSTNPTIYQTDSNVLLDGNTEAAVAISFTANHLPLSSIQPYKFFSIGWVYVRNGLDEWDARLRTSDTNPAIDIDTSPSANKKYVVLFKLSGGVLEVYVNGDIVHSGARTGAIIQSNAKLELVGSDVDGNDFVFDSVAYWIGDLPTTDNAESGSDDFLSYANSPNECWVLDGDGYTPSFTGAISGEVLSQTSGDTSGEKAPSADGGGFNAPPTGEIRSAKLVAQGQRFSASVSFFDTDGDTVSLTWRSNDFLIDDVSSKTPVLSVPTDKASGAYVVECDLYDGVNTTTVSTSVNVVEVDTNTDFLRIGKTSQTSIAGQQDYIINIQQKISSTTGAVGVLFDAVKESVFDGVSDPAKELSFWWDFGDTGREITLQNLATDSFGVDANKQQGPIASHVYPINNTGSDIEYRGSVSVYNHTTNEFAYGVFSVVVEDFESGFDEIYAYSSSGDFVGAPSSSIQLSGTLKEALSSVASSSAEKKALFINGAEINEIPAVDYEPGMIDLRNSEQLYVSSFGAGRTEIKLYGTGNLGSSLNPFVARDTSTLTFSNIKVSTDYDVTTGYGAGGLCRGMRGYNESFCVAVDSEFTGLAISFYMNDTASFVALNSGVYDWFDYGYLGGGAIGFKGCTIKQNDNAIRSGDSGKQIDSYPLTPDHGPVRVSGTTELGMSISKTEMLSNNGWFGGGETSQPALRFGTSPSGADYSSYFGSVNESYFEGGIIPVVVSTANPTHESSLIYGFIFERNILIGNGEAQEMIEISYGNSLFRSNFIKRLNVPNVGNPFLFPFSIRDGETTPLNSSAPILIYGNTISVEAQDLTSDLNVVYNPANYTNVVTENNLLFGPYMANAGELPDYMPLNESGFYEPLLGSSALSGGTGTPYVWEYLDGSLIGGAQNIGASGRYLGTTVNTGPDLTATDGETITLSSATASNYDSLQWTCTSGQSPTFSDATVLNPTVTFNEAGLHALQLTATNTEGSTSDTLTATVEAIPNTAPTANTPKGKVVYEPTPVPPNSWHSLDAGRVERGIPVGGLDISWRQLSGTTVKLYNPKSKTPSFKTPTNGKETLVFEMTAVNLYGGTLVQEVSVNIDDDQRVGN